DELPIAGRWRRGRGSKGIDDVDPYHGDTLLRLTSASPEDVDEAYRAAERARRGWAEAPPQERRDVLLRVADLLVRYQYPIVRWLIRETGATQAKANAEWRLVHEGTLEAASYPFRATG